MTHALYDFPDEDSSTHIAFLKYLLEAGADPTLGNDHSFLFVSTIYLVRENPS